ncbi:hypothetical protein SAMN05428943_1121 [Streptomyces sp. 2314.4]|nr:hypothetical protein SAMN05428943_1121 [Streptomyces sp. 2314.4]
MTLRDTLVGAAYAYTSLEESLRVMAGVTIVLERGG